ncbi:MAG: right-handed parallel beta-helix repeat-containing protein [Ginsengibacter sp.]
MKFILTGLLLVLFFTAKSQEYVVKNIHVFGAKGDGKTNDQAAFKAAADFFNARGGNGRLVIPKGTYIVGKQVYSGGQLNKPVYMGEDVLDFSNVKNVSIAGKAGAIIKYQDSLRLGAFTPETGKAYDHGNNYFVNPAYVAVIGNCISFENCSGITISNISLDGNNQNIILGGIYGDVGRQIPHNGVKILNCKSISVDQLNIHHFGLDGMIISNKQSADSDKILITNSTFEYNSRQGLSWVGGNQLYVKNCKFNHTGKGKFSSPPGAGVDIEAEVGLVRNGYFENCEFIDNTGNGMVADSGNSGDCFFTGCTFWGTTSWSIWVTKPGFSFEKCNIYGSVAHGYDSPSMKDATKFSNCLFEDKPYNGVAPYGGFLVETNNKKRMSFSGCTFISHTKKLGWFKSSAISPDEKYQFTNCSFTINNILKEGDFAAILRGAALKNCTFNFTDPDAKKKRYLLAGYGEAGNADLGGNKILYRNQ